MKTREMQFQQTLAAPRDAVFSALTDSDELASWFAEAADVSLSERRYDFWGRFTPETPSRREGSHRIIHVDTGECLGFSWNLRGADTRVEYRLVDHEDQTVLGVWHTGVPIPEKGKPGYYSMDDIWFLSLENLRRHLDGRPVMRCDFSRFGGAEVRYAIDIDGPPEAAWEALTNPTQLNRWIASNAGVEPVEGGLWNMGWGDEGAFEILALEPSRELKLRWEIDGQPTTVTWSLEGSGGKTRLTLTHSGFAPDYITDGEAAGWANFMSWIASLVEYGNSWVPPLKKLAEGTAIYYPATVGARQDEILEWEEAR